VSASSLVLSSSRPLSSSSPAGAFLASLSMLICPALPCPAPRSRPASWRGITLLSAESRRPGWLGVAWLGLGLGLGLTGVTVSDTVDFSAPSYALCLHVVLQRQRIWRTWRIWPVWRMLGSGLHRSPRPLRCLTRFSFNCEAATEPFPPRVMTHVELWTCCGRAMPVTCPRLPSAFSAAAAALGPDLGAQVNPVPCSGEPLHVLFRTSDTTRKAHLANPWLWGSHHGTEHATMAHLSPVCATCPSYLASFLILHAYMLATLDCPPGSLLVGLLT
jgi:hypothetical protein